MATIEHIQDYKVKSSDIFFFDNNVWMFLYSSAISGSKRYEQRIYGILFREIQCVKATIFINSLIASEYVNANLRLGFEQWKRIPENIARTSYKLDYRPSQSFAENRDIVYAELEQILKFAERRPDDFNAIDPIKLLGALGSKMDFNDAYYVSYCNLNNLIFVTDDKDMFDTSSDIKILTK